MEFPKNSRNKPSDIILTPGLESGFMKLLTVGDLYCTVLYKCCGTEKSLNTKYIRYRIRHSEGSPTCAKCTKKEVTAINFSRRQKAQAVSLECNGHHWLSLNWDNTPRALGRSNY